MSVTIEAFGSTSLVADGSHYFLQPNGGSAVELSNGGSPVVAGQYGQWAPIAANQTASGYQVVWKLTGADQYLAWNTDSSGNCVSGALDPASGTSTALKAMEVSFQQDLNGDGSIGNGDGSTGAPPPSSSTVIEAFGSTSLVADGSHYFLQPNGGSAVELSNGGSPVVAGQYGQWAPIAANQTASGYQVVWKLTGADQYLAWNTDSSGNCVSGALDPTSGTSTALKAMEVSFQQDLNGDGSIGNGDGSTGASSAPHFVYRGVDSDGAQIYDVTWDTPGSQPSAVRVLTPDHPSTSYSHTFLYALPVEAGLAQLTFGSGLDELQKLGVQNQYNATIIEPIFPINSWYADSSIDRP